MAESLAHTKWLCKYHLVFSPKYRRKIIYHQLRSDIQGYIKNLCQWKGVDIIEGHMMGRSCPSSCVDTTQIQHLIVHGIFERKICHDDFRKTCKSEV